MRRSIRSNRRYSRKDVDHQDLGKIVLQKVWAFVNIAFFCLILAFIALNLYRLGLFFLQGNA